MVKRLRLRPLTPATRVRFPHESPKRYILSKNGKNKYKRIVGVDDAEGPPVPIPNTEVKLSGAENTWLVTARENREMPTQAIHPNGCFALYSSIAQSVVATYIKIPDTIHWFEETSNYHLNSLPRVRITKKIAFVQS